MHWDIQVPWYAGIMIFLVLLGLWLAPGLALGYWIWGH